MYVVENITLILQLAVRSGMASELRDVSDSKINYEQKQQECFAFLGHIYCLLRNFKNILH